MNASGVINLPTEFPPELRRRFRGELHTDQAMRRIYATDASVYREVPMAVAWPADEEDLRLLVEFATRQSLPLVPRSAGTSLAGQAVGKGIVVDVSRHMNRILDLDEDAATIWVEPGVVRDELNRHLVSKGLMFAPDTSTSNRATIGGMVGNNSCGTGSIVYGSTRDHVAELRCVLSDGSIASFGETDDHDLDRLAREPGVLGKVHQWLRETLSDRDHVDELMRNCPAPSIRRRNTGYALDLLVGEASRAGEVGSLNLCTLLCGSEGTLALTSRIKLKLVPVPKGIPALMVAHMETIDEAARATQIALRHSPQAVELLDRLLLQCAARNPEQKRNQFFLEGDPGALLAVELRADTEEELAECLANLEREFRSSGLGYAFPILRGAQRSAVWDLRKAGLGTLANLSGDAKAVACIEDTAVAVADLPQYLHEFQQILDRYQRECIYYGHIGDGELHLRPVLDLRRGPDRKIFHDLTEDVALLVKKYRGSLSGEHGDGRVRGGFLQMMVGPQVYRMYCDLKACWDPAGIFNPGRITDVPDMLTDLRATSRQQDADDIQSIMRFAQTNGLGRMAENCNGSGDCRKDHTTGGVMCPSYMATRDERHTTRARANLLREMIQSPDPQDPLAHQDLVEILDLCLSCKGCKTECPSNVDMALLKAEVMQHHYDARGAPVRSRMVAEYPLIAKWVSNIPGGPWLMNLPTIQKLTKQGLGVAAPRNLPQLAPTTLSKWAAAHLDTMQPDAKSQRGRVLFYADEFTNLQDLHIGIEAMRLMTNLGYRVEIAPFIHSGRTHLSKGFVRRAKEIANENVRTFASMGDDGRLIVALEPSTILTFRDEYLELVDDDLLPHARVLSSRAMTWEEWFCHEVAAGIITSDDFFDTQTELLVHNHCHQRAVGDASAALKALSVPKGFRPASSNAGCCGMAGAFGYEEEHYDLSVQIAELSLIPAVRSADSETWIVASGTSCRHQILDISARQAIHPVQAIAKVCRHSAPSHS